MLAILRTICGAERIVDLPYRDRELHIPYAETRSAFQPSSQVEMPIFMRRVFKDTGLVEHRKLEGYTTSPWSNGEVQLRVFLEVDALAPLAHERDRLTRRNAELESGLRAAREAADTALHGARPPVTLRS